jgi:hypothetical protein
LYALQYCPNDDCVVTRGLRPLDPEADERKYHSPGVGVFLEVNRGEQTINQLVGVRAPRVFVSRQEVGPRMSYPGPRAP